MHPIHASQGTEELGLQRRLLLWLLAPYLRVVINFLDQLMVNGWFGARWFWDSRDTP